MSGPVKGVERASASASTASAAAAVKNAGDGKKPVKKSMADPNDVSKAVLDSYMQEHFPEERKRKAEDEVRMRIRRSMFLLCVSH